MANPLLFSAVENNKLDTVRNAESIGDIRGSGQNHSCALIIHLTFFHPCLFSIKVAKLLESDDALVNSMNSGGQTPLHIATSRLNTSMVQLLLSYGADVTARTLERYGGLCPLHLAARYDHTEIGQELIRYGAPVNGLSTTNSTPLIEAAKFGSVNFVVWLLTLNGIDATAADSSGFSANYYARKAGNAELIKLLPPVKFDIWAQLKSEPKYANNLAGVQATIAKKEAVAQKKLEAAEKKKKKKLW